MNEICPICAIARWTQAYGGRIRRGQFGDWIVGTVWRCESCGLEYLPPSQSDLKGFYESEEYRRSVDAGADVETFRRLHDATSVRWLGMIDGGLLRNAVIANVGCGAGSFLDGAGGYARQVVAIEPMREYHRDLAARGFHVYPYAGDAAADWAGKVDVACSFSVLEHVPQPVTLLKEIRSLLKTSGSLYLTTPNRNDVLVRIKAPEFDSFFYRAHHIYYFDAVSLRAAAIAAGFASATVRSIHSYGLMNLVGWLTQRRPTGNSLVNPLDDRFDAAWRKLLEEHDLGDYLWLHCIA